MLSRDPCELPSRQRIGRSRAVVAGLAYRV